MGHDMIDSYRLAVVRDRATSLVVVERQQRLLPLASLLDASQMAALGGLPADLMPLLSDWRRWSALLADVVATSIAKFEREGQESAGAEFLPPIAAPGKLICIGANYWDHIEEMPIPVNPTYPYAFLKPPGNTLRGSGQAVNAPANVAMFDWEAELAAVIGTRAHNVMAADALDHVAGYTNFNDLSARDWLASRPGVGVDWVRHKCFDGFAPMGPYLLPAQFVADPQNLPVRLSVNGVIKQASSTAKMVFGVAAIIEHLSGIMTLEPGDIIATGTPAGVAHGRQPPEYLKAGDIIRIEIGELGELVTPIIAAA